MRLLLLFAIFSLSAFGQCGALGKMIINPRTHMADCTPSVIADTIANIPATCTVGQLYFATNATAGQNLYECAPTNTWTQQLNSGGGAAGGVLSGTYPNPGFTASDVAFTGEVTTNAGSFHATSGHVYLSTLGGVRWIGSSSLFNISNGVVAFYDSTFADFGRIQLGGSTASFPSLKRSATGVAFRVADDSADAPITALNGTFSGAVSGKTYLTATNCASSGGTCGSAASGSVAVAAAATTVTVATTAVTANSTIFLQDDSSLGTKLGVTCNTTVPTAYSVTARTAATSFVITATSPITNPACFNYWIVN